MKALIVTLVALFALVSAQNLSPPWADWSAFSCSFTCTAPQFGSGYFTGSLVYDWTIGAYQISYDNAQGYTEFYQFNGYKGYNNTDTIGQFTYQYMYKTSNLCPCETTALNFSMPALFPSSANPGMASIFKNANNQNAVQNYWLAGNTDSTTFSTPAVKYIANDQFFLTNKQTQQTNSFSLSSFFWLRNGQPAGFNINDFQRRTFEFSSCKAGSPGNMGLIAPTTGCKCGKQMDIVISLDRSGSISYNQWLLEYQFVQNLIAAFNYGPLATNLGIVNWNAAQWVTLPIGSGTDSGTVTSAVNSMTCCPGASSTSCCCCGTPIGGGIWEGCSMLATSSRGRAQKVLILLTDGCQNHLWDMTTQTAIACACASEKACASNATCTGDITTYYNWCQQNVPGTKVIVIGVGGQDTICTDQLLIAAGGDPSNVYNPTSWTQLQTLIQTITATACSADNALCPGCCGICTCGQCIPPTQCANQTLCSLGYLDTSTGCCASSPVVCNPPPCQYGKCFPTTGCQYTPIQCPPDDPTTPCQTSICNNSYTCSETKKTNPDGTPLAQCTTVVVNLCPNGTTCDDGSACTNDSCDPKVGCVNTQITCPANDKCTSWSCRPAGNLTGCIPTTKPCDDRNACTSDSCDPLMGCKFVNITCAQPKDGCQKVACDTVNGCYTYARDCSLEGFVAANCTVPACNNTCYNQYICAAPPPTSAEDFPQTAVLASTIGTAALAGIVIACVLIAAGAGGGAAVAIAQVGIGGGAVVTASNPLYAGAGMGGDNPLNNC